MAAPAGRPDENPLPARTLFLDPDFFRSGVFVGAVRRCFHPRSLDAKSPQSQEDMDPAGVVVCVQRDTLALFRGGDHPAVHDRRADCHAGRRAVWHGHGPAAECHAHQRNRALVDHGH